MKNLDQVIKEVLGISEKANDLTPMDKGECKRIVREVLEKLKVRIESEKNKRCYNDFDEGVNSGISISVSLVDEMLRKL